MESSRAIGRPLKVHEIKNPVVALETLIEVLKITSVYHRQLRVFFVYRDSQFTIDPSARKLHLIFMPSKDELINLTPLPITAQAAQLAVLNDIHRLVAYCERLLFCTRAIIPKQDRDKAIWPIRKLERALIHKDADEISRLYDQEIFPALDRLLVQSMGFSVVAADAVEQTRAAAATDNAIETSLLRPLAVGEGESRVARGDVPGNEGRPPAAMEKATPLSEKLAKFFGQLNGRVITEKKRLRHILLGRAPRSFTLEVLPRPGTPADFIIRVNAPYEITRRRWTMGNNPFGENDLEKFAGLRTVGIILLRGGYSGANSEKPALYIDAIDFTPAERMGLYSATCKRLAGICPVGTYITFVNVDETRSRLQLSLGRPFLNTVLGRPFRGTGFETAYQGKSLPHHTSNTLEVILEKKGIGRQDGALPIGYIDLIGDRNVVYTKTRLQHEPLITFLKLNRIVPIKKLRSVLLTGITPYELEIFTELNKEAGITIIDLDKKQLETLTGFLNTHPRIARRVSLFRADAASLGPGYFPDNYFDFAYLGVLDESAYHDTNDAQRLLPLIANEQTRVVAPGGYIFHYTQKGALYYKPAIDAGVLEIVHPDVSVVFRKKNETELQSSVLRPQAAGER